MPPEYIGNVPGVKGTFRIRGLTGAEVARIMSQSVPWEEVVSQVLDLAVVEPKVLPVLPVDALEFIKAKINELTGEQLF